MDNHSDIIIKMSNNEYLNVSLAEAFTTKDFRRASKYKTIDEAQIDLEFLSLGDVFVLFDQNEIHFDKFMIMETTIKDFTEYFNIKKGEMSNDNK